MSAGKWSPGPVIDRGGAWDASVYLQDSAGSPIEITAPGVCEIRSRPDRNSALIARLDDTGDGDGDVVFGPDTNLVRLHLPASFTVSMVPGEYAFDLFVTNAAGDRERLVFGTVTVRGEVSAL